MRPHYLEHLARRGLADIHPLGAAASQILLNALQLDVGQRVLEIGCGTGRTLLRVAGRSVHHVYGIEILPVMLASARRRLKTAASSAPILLVEGSAMNLPFPPAGFTRVYMESVLGFQNETIARRMLAEISRVLSTGGRYVANEAIWRSGVSALEARQIYESCLADFGLCQASPQLWNVADWCAAMEDAGFQVVAADKLEDKVANQPESVSINRQEDDDSLTHSVGRHSNIHPRMLWERVKYRRLLARHKLDGLAMESRLFIMEKR